MCVWNKHVAFLNKVFTTFETFILLISYFLHKEIMLLVLFFVFNFVDTSYKIKVEFEFTSPNKKMKLRFPFSHTYVRIHTLADYSYGIQNIKSQANMI